MILCGGCSKKIKTKGKYLRTCKKCGHAICKCCNVEGFCSSCHPANNDRNVVYEYFREKYTKSILSKPLTSLMFVLLLIMALSVSGSTLAYQTSLINKSCDWINYPTIESIPVYEEVEEYDAKNDTWTRYDRVTGYTKQSTDNYVLECDTYIHNGNTDIDFKREGYECRQTNGVIVCDSCSDGNCNGVCDPNGGETCVKITASDIVYKNSRTDWKGTPINVRRLSVR